MKAPLLHGPRQVNTIGETGAPALNRLKKMQLSGNHHLRQPAAETLAEGETKSNCSPTPFT
jgi:hypothetical protein